MSEGFIQWTLGDGWRFAPMLLAVSGVCLIAARVLAFMERGRKGASPTAPIPREVKTALWRCAIFASICISLLLLGWFYS